MFNKRSLLYYKYIKESNALDNDEEYRPRRESSLSKKASSHSRYDSPKGLKSKNVKSSRNGKTSTSDRKARSHRNRSPSYSDSSSSDRRNYSRGRRGRSYSRSSSRSSASSFDRSSSSYESEGYSSDSSSRSYRSRSYSSDSRSYDSYSRSRSRDRPKARSRSPAHTVVKDAKAKVTGDRKNVKPIDYFTDAPLPDPVLKNVRDAKYKKPTVVQRHAIPILISKQDLMASSQTGSGKTVAFLFPIIHGIYSNKDNDVGHLSMCPKALVLAPTRELAQQIHQESVRFTKRTNVRAVCIYGGAPLESQWLQMKQGCDILIATPGRLVDFIERGKISLSRIRYLCLDEADRMLDMGFEPQIRHIVQKHDVPKKRQTMMFSATFPRAIQNLARDFLTKEYVFLKIGSVGSTNDNITQHIKLMKRSEKEQYLIKELKNSKYSSTLVFCETKRQVDYLQHKLMVRGFKVAAIHGDKSQMAREQALGEFKVGKIKILIATSVAARGIDIDNISHVINYDLPKLIDDYTHRIGRTGRIGNKGTATAFFTEDNFPIARDLIEKLKESKQKVPEWLEEMRFS